MSMASVSVPVPAYAKTGRGSKKKSNTVVVRIELDPRMNLAVEKANFAVEHGTSRVSYDGLIRELLDSYRLHKALTQEVNVDVSRSELLEDTFAMMSIH